MTADFEEAYLSGSALEQQAKTAIGSVLTQLPQTQQAVSEFSKIAAYVNTPEFRDQVADVKQEASDTATLLAALFTLSTIFAGIQCFIALHTFMKKRP